MSKPEESVYDFNFDIIDEERYKAVTSLDEVTFSELHNGHEVSPDQLEQIGRISLLQTETVETPTLAPVVAPETLPLPVDTPPSQIKPSIPRDLVRARKTVAGVLNGQDEVFTQTIELSELAFNGVRVSSNSYKNFQRELAQDPRVDYFGGGFLALTNHRNIPEAYWPYDKPDLDYTLLQEIVDSVITSSKSTGFGLKKLFVVAESMKEDLSPEEAHELVALAASDPRVIAREDRRFFVKSDDNVPNKETDIKFKDGKDRYNRKEVQTISRVLHGKTHRVLGQRRVKHKKTYETLTRAPRIVNPSRLLDL